jgi:hypothetical protein
VDTLHAKYFCPNPMGFRQMLHTLKLASSAILSSYHDWALAGQPVAACPGAFTHR